MINAPVSHTRSPPSAARKTTKARRRGGSAPPRTATGGKKLNMAPLAVGKLTAINGKPVDAIKFADESSKDSADRQLRLSWASELPPSNQIVAGQWPGAHPAQATVSIDTSWRDRFALKLGDTLSFSVGEGTIDAKIGSIRKVDW